MRLLLSLTTDVGTENVLLFRVAVFRAAPLVSCFAGAATRAAWPLIVAGSVDLVMRRLLLSLTTDVGTENVLLFRVAVFLAMSFGVGRPTCGLSSACAATGMTIVAVRITKTDSPI